MMIIDLILVIEMIVHGFKMFSKSSFAFFPRSKILIFSTFLPGYLLFYRVQTWMGFENGVVI